MTSDDAPQAGMAADRLSTAQPSRWRDAFAAWRDRLVASHRFQRWAAGFWLTRPLARRRAAQLFDLVAGFVYSQVLSACVRLDLFDHLGRNGPQTLEALASQGGMPPRAMQRLLDAAVSISLLRRLGDGRYALGALGAPLVGNEPLKAMIAHHAALYADLRDPVALLREEGVGSSMSAYWPYAAYDAPGQLTEQRVAEYSALMTASQPMVIDEVLDAYDFGRHRQMLDVGGGEGRFVSEVARRHPDLAITLFDLPPVAELARRRLQGLGLGARVRTAGGSFFDDALPPGADLITLVRVLFDHDDEHALAILRAARQALQPGGIVLVAEPMARTPGAHAMGDAYFGFYLLAMGRGQPRSAEDMVRLLGAAGFHGARSVRTRVPLQAGVVIARS
jgi:demethylspheroidene O-methyltransferase